MRRADLLALAAMAGWGAAYVPSAWLVERWPLLASAGARLAVGGLVLLAVVRALGRPIGPGVGIGVVAWLALTQTVVFYGATYWGIAHAGAGLSAVLANTDPLFVAVLAAVVLRERLDRRQWTGLGVGLAGAMIAMWQGPVWPPEISLDALVVVGGAIGWSLGTVVAARGLGRAGAPIALAGWQMACGGGVLILAGAVLEDVPPAVGGRELALIAWLAILGSAVPLALFYVALARAPAGEVSAWFFLVPVVGALSAWPLLGETPTGRLVVGMVAVALGLWLVMGVRGRPGGLVDSSAPP